MTIVHDTDETIGMSANELKQLRTKVAAIKAAKVTQIPTPPDTGPSSNAAMPIANTQQDLPEIYYEGATKDYWRRDSRRGYIKVSLQALRPYLKSLGYCAAIKEKEVISELDEVLLEIQTCHNVDYEGPLAGYTDKSLG